MKSEPILALKNGETVMSMMYDRPRGAVLVGTSDGRILIIRRLGMNAFMAGDRTIYASAIGPSGEESDAKHRNVRYGIIDRILEISSSHEIARWKKFENPTGIDSNKKSIGTFTTPVLWAGENFGWWGDLSWSQSLPDGCRVVVQARMAGSSDAVSSAKWMTLESDSSGMVVKSLDESSIAGSYAQIRVHLESPAGSDSPEVSTLILPFFTRHVSYFFTVKMSMHKGTDIRGGMLVGVVSMPENTDVKWGVANSASADWNDYVEVTPGKAFTLPEGFGDRIKVGARMVSYDDERYPSVDEFSLTFDSDVDNLIGRMP